jgi:hypothetical protein
MVGPRSRTPTLRDSLSEPSCSFAADSKDAAGRSGAPRLTAPSRPEVGRPEHRFRFLTLNEVAERLNVSSRTVRRWTDAQSQNDPELTTVRQNQQPAPKRPTEYTKEIGQTICGRLVEDENLRSICAEPGMPDVATVSRWISNNGEFRDMYALAREFQAHCIADEVIELANEVSTEWVEKVRANGRVVWGADRKNLPRYRLRTEVRHWVASNCSRAPVS